VAPGKLGTLAAATLVASAKASSSRRSEGSRSNDGFARAGAWAFVGGSAVETETETEAEAEACPSSVDSPLKTLWCHSLGQSAGKSWLFMALPFDMKVFGRGDSWQKSPPEGKLSVERPVL
jgi:hypothetical protein